MIIHSPASLAGEYLSVGYLFIGKQGDWEISGKLVMAQPAYACKVAEMDNPDEINGAIVATQHGKCLEGQQGRTLQSMGALGMALLSGSTFLNGGLKNNDGEGLDEFPMVDIVALSKLNSLKEALNNQEEIWVTITPDPNYIADETIWIPYSVFIIAFSCVNIGLAVWKLHMFITLVGVQLSLSQIVLTLEVFANIMRILHGIEPASEGRGAFPVGLQSILFTFSWPYSFISTMMIAFYWEETLGRFSGKAGLSKENMTSLKRMKIPAMVISFILVTLEHVLGGLRAGGVVGLGFTAYITSALYLAIALVVGCYFVVTGCRVVSFLRKTIVSNSGTHLLKRMGLLISISGFGLLLYIVGNLITAASLSSANMRLIAFSEALLFLGLDVSSATQILCFTSPNEEPSNSNSLSGSKSQKSKKETEGISTTQAGNSLEMGNKDYFASKEELTPSL